MKIEVRPAIDELRDSLCRIEISTISIITESLKRLSFELGSTSTAPKIIANWVKNFSHEYGWIESFRINPDIPKDLPTANYLMDAILDQYDADCGHHHRFLVQTCFDNRQALGTNLLKFEIAQFKFCKTPKHKTLSIIICGEPKTLKNLKWDGSVASSSEYELALSSGYCGVLEVNPLLIVLRDHS